MTALHHILDVLDTGATVGLFVAAALIPILTVLRWFGFGPQ